MIDLARMISVTADANRMLVTKALSHEVMTPLFLYTLIPNEIIVSAVKGTD